MFRVLVVDDSVVLRQMVSTVLGRHRGIEVVGTASDGVIALERIAALDPDLVLLDLDMPELDGLEVLRRCRTTGARTRFLVFSGRVKTGGADAMDALALGALECVAKAERGAPMVNALAWIEAELLPRVRALAGLPGAMTPARPAAHVAPARQASAAPGPPPTEGPIDAVVIASSTGGPAALEQALRGLPADWPVPIFLVQHMPIDFTEHFAQSLRRQLTLCVEVAEKGAHARPGTLYLAPGDRHLVLTGSRLHCALDLVSTPPENSCRPSADPLMRSAAAIYGDRLLAIVLTGMGHDGLNGARAVRDAGGCVWAQDEASSVVWGMPGSVVQAQLAKRVLPLSEIGPSLRRAMGTAVRA